MNINDIVVPKYRVLFCQKSGDTPREYSFLDYARAEEYAESIKDKAKWVKVQVDLGKGWQDFS